MLRLSLVIFPVVPELRHVEKEFISTETSDTAGHDPRRRSVVVLSEQINKALDVLVW